jgi:glycerate kinase
VIGLGGSATSDGGAGMLAELGAVAVDAAGAPVDPSPAALARVARVELAGLDPRLAEVDVEVARDVSNPLLGPDGAARVFGPQKGASPDDVAVIEAGLTSWAVALVEAVGAEAVGPGRAGRDRPAASGPATPPAPALAAGAVGAGRDRAAGRELAAEPGAGAAGGLGFAFLCLGARLVRGVELVADQVQLSRQIAGADLVLTGEGSLDAQTMAGKTPLGVAEAAGRLGVPVIAFAGRLGADPAALARAGFAAAFAITPGPTSLARALAAGAENLERAVESALRVYALGRTPEAR